MSTTDLQELVGAFNKLSRSPKTESGFVRNHWYFTIMHVPFKPSGDLLHLINPGSRYTHTEGPAQILSLESKATQAQIILPLLLKAFVTSMGNSDDPNFKPLAPWSWGTENEELAKALEKQLQSSGVRDELCTIEVGNKEHRAIQLEVWTNLFYALQQQFGPVPRCHQCSSLERDDQKLMLCSGCKKVQYCSKDCQRFDWKAHKIVCMSSTTVTTGAAVGSSSSPPSVDVLKYYHQIAPSMPEAQALASQIGLAFPPISGGIK